MNWSATARKTREDQRKTLKCAIPRDDHQASLVVCVRPTCVQKTAKRAFGLDADTLRRQENAPQLADPIVRMASFLTRQSQQGKSNKMEVVEDFRIKTTLSSAVRERIFGVA